MPEIENLSKELKEKYDWLPNLSITFMEFLHGALRTKNKNACFFLRTKDSLDNIPVEFNDKFFETNSLSKLQLKVLTNYLKRNLPNPAGHRQANRF